MRLLILLPLFFLLLLAGADAQKKKTYTINPGTRFTEIIPNDEIYQYPDFAPGKVYFKNGSISPGLLNYNFLFAEMQFIDPKGDTLSLANEETIGFITIAKDTFYYDNGYLKFISNSGEFKLAQKQYFDIANKEKIGAMGVKTSASIDTYTRVMDNYRTKGLIAQEIVTLVRNDVYYFGDKFNHFKRLNKKNMLGAYPAKEKEIRNYFKENSPKEITGEQLTKLMEALNNAN